MDKRKFMYIHIHVTILYFLSPSPIILVAIPYYLLNLRATIKLGHPIYYNKDAWVALIKQVHMYVYMHIFTCDYIYIHVLICLYIYVYLY
jgi:hypothetical protein